jgi:hypothetical protein
MFATPQARFMVMNLHDSFDSLFASSHTHRVTQHPMASIIGRVVEGMAVFFAIAVCAFLVAGVAIPWIAFGIVTLMGMAIAVWDSTDWS